MQIFIIGTIFDTAMSLDKRRFHRQISEAKIIRDAIDGKNKWKGPLVEMYRYNTVWLDLYIATFEAVKNGNILAAINISCRALQYTPDFHIDVYFNNMKSRLYTKDESYYSSWKEYGKSYVNMYITGDTWRFITQEKEA